MSDGPAAADETAAAEHRLVELTGKARENRERRAALIQRLEALTATEVGAQGAIRVTVAAAGQLTGLDLSDQARSLPAAHLAAQILAAVRRAQATLARQVAALAGAADDPVADGMAARYRAQFPEQPIEQPVEQPVALPGPMPRLPRPPVSPAPPPVVRQPTRSTARDDDSGDEDFSQQSILRKY